ncbi:MAG: hypothetical protein AB1420_02570 [Bacillota bacterium]
MHVARKKPLVLCLVIIAITAAFALTACGERTHLSVAALMKSGRTGDWVNFKETRVKAMSHDPILSQTSLQLETGENEQYVTAVAANAMVKKGLERLQAEEDGLVLKIYGRLSEHDTLGWLIFVHELEVLE